MERRGIDYRLIKGGSITDVWCLFADCVVQVSWYQTILEDDTEPVAAVGIFFRDPDSGRIGADRTKVISIWCDSRTIRIGEVSDDNADWHDALAQAETRSLQDEGLDQAYYARFCKPAK